MCVFSTIHIGQMPAGAPPQDLGAYGYGDPSTSGSSNGYSAEQMRGGRYSPPAANSGYLPPPGQQGYPWNQEADGSAAAGGRWDQPNADPMIR